MEDSRTFPVVELMSNFLKRQKQEWAILNNVFMQFVTLCITLNVFIVRTIYHFVNTQQIQLPQYSWKTALRLICRYIFNRVINKPLDLYFNAENSRTVEMSTTMNKPPNIYTTDSSRRPVSNVVFLLQCRIQIIVYFSIRHGRSTTFETVFEFGSTIEALGWTGSTKPRYAGRNSPDWFQTTCH